MLIGPHEQLLAVINTLETWLIDAYHRERHSKSPRSLDEFNVRRSAKGDQGKPGTETIEQCTAIAEQDARQPGARRRRGDVPHRIVRDLGIRLRAHDG